MDLLEGLNEEQRAAVRHEGGPLMIVAGAGTGKTTVITRRIAWLIDSGQAKPENILALTFTDKAAGEMEERVDLLLPYGYVDLQISTFHAFCERLLRDYGVEIGLSRDFKLVDELDSWLLARTHFERFSLDHYRPLGNPTKYLRGLLTHFSRCKDEVITPERYQAHAEELLANADGMTSNEEAESDAKRLHELAGAYQTYQQILLEHDSLDFGDLLMYSLKLLKERPKVLEEVRKRFSFTLVDEFQDTNVAQYELVKLIAAPQNNLTVVGDDDQSIYQFRGASIGNILQFKSDFPEAKEIVLTQNYRSVQPILDKSHAFIQANNPNRLEADGTISKQLSSNREGEGLVEHLHADSIEEEAATVARRIVDLKEQYPEASWNDFGILVRANDAATPFLRAMERRDIPFQFLALRGLYAKPIVLDMLAYLRAIDQPMDSPSLFRVLAHDMHGLSNAALIALNHLARRKGKGLWDAAQLARGLNALDVNDMVKVDELLASLERWRLLAREKRATEVFVTVARESGLIGFINAMEEREKQEAFKFLQQLYERVKGFEARYDDPSLKHFLEEFAHERDAGEEGSLSTDLDAGPELVRVMTVHASKGLEFRFVFVVSLIDRRFPASARAEAIPLPDDLRTQAKLEGNAHLEEERRLFYVAMTRAKEGLFLTSACDYGGARKRKLSRFLDELGYEKPEGKDLVADELFAAVEEKKKNEAPFVIQLPKQYSFTQLTAFRSCPLQYKFAHILKIPVFGKWTLSFGKTMHNTLQAYFTEWMERQGKAQGSLFDAPAETAAEGPAVSLDELLSLYDRHWIDDWYANDRQREEYRKKGRESLKGYFAFIQKKEPSPVALERGFTLKFGDVILKGRIDRIDAFEDGVEIIDYKTGKPKTEKTLDRGDKEQLLLYQIAARDILGMNPKRLTYHYLEDNSEVSFIGSDDDLLNLQEEIVERVQSIRKSQFDPTPGFHCKFCDFSDICEYRQ